MTAKAWLVAMTGLCVAACAGEAQEVTSSSPASNPEEACGDTSPAPEAVLVVIDGTDALSPIDQARARQAIDRYGRELRAHGRFVLATLNRAAPDDPTLLFNGCSPGSRVEPGVHTGRNYLRRKFEADFSVPLSSAGTTAMNQEAGYPSPILETVMSLSRHPTLTASAAEKRRFVIVSDLLQAGEDYSHLRLLEDQWERYRKSTLGKRFLPDLSGVEVVVILIERPESVAHQNAEHRAFWERWFREAGAASVAFEGGGRPSFGDVSEKEDAE